MASTLLRSATATGRAVRRGVSSSRAVPTQPRRCYSHGGDELTSSSRHLSNKHKSNYQVDMLLDEIKETEISSLTEDMVAKTIESAVVARKQIVSENSRRKRIVIGSVFAGFWSGYFGYSTVPSPRRGGEK